VVLIDPRGFCTDKHHQIDDEIYGWGQGMLMKAEPLVLAVENALNQCSASLERTKIVYLAPSELIFDQQKAVQYCDLEHLVLICWRYEGIDHRMELVLEDRYPWVYEKISLWSFITMGAEAPAMVVIEAVTRLMPGVIGSPESWQDESYQPWVSQWILEYPQYTRPEEIFGHKVPDVLLSGNHAKIQQWKKENRK
jgi:tRNA (guanine37-N1)-methyltransferase